MNPFSNLNPSLKKTKCKLPLKLEPSPLKMSLFPLDPLVWTHLKFLSSMPSTFPPKFKRVKLKFLRKLRSVERDKSSVNPKPPSLPNWTSGHSCMVWKSSAFMMMDPSLDKMLLVLDHNKSLKNSKRVFLTLLVSLYNSVSLPPLPFLTWSLMHSKTLLVSLWSQITKSLP